MLTAARIAEIFIQDERVSTSFRGVVSNVERLRGAIEALGRLAAESGAG